MCRNDPEIYAHRETIGLSLEGLKMECLTISSFSKITNEREQLPKD